MGRSKGALIRSMSPERRAEVLAKILAYGPGWFHAKSIGVRTGELLTLHNEGIIDGRAERSRLFYFRAKPDGGS